MQTNSMLELARKTRKLIRQVFEDKVDTIVAYDIVEDPNHSAFKLKFMAYDYFGIQFSYELGLMGFSIVLNDQFGVSLSKHKYAYSEVEDWERYLREIMAEIELRIPDKFLKAKGWL
ncbi:hypothetical protein HCC47_08860 [Streptococcus suis]|nr:hypothetical protein [Streptococcus suis]